MKSSVSSPPSSSDPERLRHLASVGSLVVKLGTQLLTDSTGRLDGGFVSQMAREIAELRSRGLRVTIVSSGAIGAGVRELNLPKRPADLPTLQAVAAIGQRRLMDHWADAFEPFSMPVAQILLTREDIDHRMRFLNLRNTIHAVHQLGGIPIVNENDTISTDEIVRISFGDNDILAALVSSALRSDLLVLLSVVDGVLDSTGKPVRLINSIGTAQQLVRPDKSPLGKGGMNSKFEAARIVTHAGSALAVCDGRMPRVLTRLLAGEQVGTLFVPAAKRARGRSLWISAARTRGSILVDEGCVRAIVQRNRSLLPAGILAVQGDFERGDVVAVVSPDGHTIARGLTNYASDEVQRIRGRKTSEVKALFPEGAAYEEVIHRDNLVVAQDAALTAIED